MSKGLSQEGTKMVGTTGGRVLKIVIKRKGNALRAGGSVPGAGQAPSATAYRRKLLLEGYPSPSASAHAIVSSLRAGWQGFPPSSELPRWDECLVIPVILADVPPPQPRKVQRDGKRSRDQLEPSSEADNAKARASKRVASCQPEAPCSKEAAEQQHKDVAGKQETPAPAAEQEMEHECETRKLETLTPAAAKKHPFIDEPLEQHVQSGPGSTTSDDQATMTIFPSPEQPEAQAASCQQERADQTAATCQEHAEQGGTTCQQEHAEQAAATCQQEHAKPAAATCQPEHGGQAAATPQEHGGQAAATGRQEHAEQAAATSQQEEAEQASAQCTTQQEDLRPQHPSVGCQAGCGALLPLSCLDSSGRSSSAASMSSLTPFELHSPRSARRPADKVDDDFISSIMQKAKEAKYAADKQRGGMTAPWTVEALCKYVQSAIMFMEACEYILRATKDRTGRLMKLKASTVPGLYGSTAKLLSYTANAAETAVGPELGKDALRILSERLCALCQLREAVHSQSRFVEASTKAQQLSHRFSQQAQHPAEAGAHPTGDPEATHGQPSPNDSMNSSQDVVMASSRAPHHAPAAPQPVQPPHAESIQRLVEQAKAIARFSELIRRSTLGFQTFLERPDYRSSQGAKQVSVHIAVVSMDFGCVDGFRLLAHASKALVSIAEMSVAAH